MEIFDLTLKQLTRVFEKDFGKGEYHAGALYRNVFKAGSLSFFKCSEFLASPVFAEKLKDQITLTPDAVAKIIQEGRLTKFITQLSDGKKIESVIIPMTNHKTLCVSSQVGCKMGCRFCETGKMGFVRDLTVSEIISQLFNARFVLQQDIKNVVFMGMGEPLDNFDAVVQAIRIMNEQKGFNIAPRHITVSTAGLINGIKKIGQLGLTGLRLAISINAADDKTRSLLMPVNVSSPLKRLKQVLEAFPMPKRGCFLFEYILIKDLNDSQKDAIKLAEYIKPLPVRLNLIPYNPVDGFNYESPNDNDLNRFADTLRCRGVFVIKRWSKGQSVSAGCGQLGRHC